MAYAPHAGGVGAAVVGTLLLKSPGPVIMPVYQYECTQGHQFEAYVQKFGETCPCKVCGNGEVERIWSITKRDAKSVFPYITTNITPDGSPVEVRSALHLEQLCKENGVVHRPDAAFLTKEYLGYDWRSREQKYKESGTGMPGCWV